MRLRQIAISSALTLSMLVLPVYATQGQSIVTLDFEQARTMAIDHSENLKLRDEMIDMISQKNALQKQDPHQNNPDYEYHGITKVPLYNNSYKTYDYEKILKNITRQRKKELFENENKTFSHFKKIYDLEKQIKDKKLAITNQEKLVYQEKIKLKNDITIPLNLSNQENSLDLLKIQLADLNNKLTLEKSEFKKHLGLSQDTEVDITLTEPDLSNLLTPDDALAKAMLNNNEFMDLKEDMDELISDMKWIDLFNEQGTVKQQQKLIDKKQEDIDEKKRTTLYSYNSTVNQIMVLMENLKKDKLDMKTLELQKQKAALLAKSGLSTSNPFDQMNYAISQNLLSQNEIVLKIRQLMLDYYTSINL